MTLFEEINFCNDELWTAHTLSIVAGMKYFNYMKDRFSSLHNCYIAAFGKLPDKYPYYDRPYECNGTGCNSLHLNFNYTCLIGEVPRHLAYLTWWKDPVKQEEFIEEYKEGLEKPLQDYIDTRIKQKMIIDAELGRVDAIFLQPRVQEHREIAINTL